MLYELSTHMYPGMPRYDETIPDVRFEARTRTPNDVNNTSSVQLFLHAGSHVDAPFHFDGSGRTIDQIPIERFIYRRALLANIPKGKNGRITEEELRKINGIDQADLLMIYTGYSSFIDDPLRYPDGFPALDDSAACFLRRECPELVGVAIDSLSIEGADGCEHGFSVHHELLDENGRTERSLLVFENIDMTPLANVRKFFRVYAFPIRFPGLDAAPINMVAETE